MAKETQRTAPTLTRCGWAEMSQGDDLELYVRYHDREWGVPLHDDRLIFEHLCLEVMQAGLSWLTVLRKRENFRRAFAGFDPARIARFDKRRVARLLTDPGIIRNRLKVEAVVANAKAFLRVQKEFGSFSAYIWGFVGGRTLVNRRRAIAEIPARTEVSDALSQDLKARGFRFVGSTICYAHMQATGLVNDHLVSCFRWPMLGGKSLPRADVKRDRQTGRNGPPRRRAE